MEVPSVSRRGFLAGGLGLAAGVLLEACGGSSVVINAATTLPAGSDLGSVEHVVMLMLENRSFDHYFGVYPGVRGFDDHPAGINGAFAQRWPASSGATHPATLLPYHLDVATTMAQCAGNMDIPIHSWIPQHQSWNSGSMDSFVATHSQTVNDGAAQGPLVMGYLTRQDMPFRYAVADAFTIADGYYSSVIGPTMPNRLVWLSGMIDPSGTQGGPVLETPNLGSEATDAVGSCGWTTVPELLEDKGVSWKVYQPPLTAVGPLIKSNLAIGFNALLYFKQFMKAGSSLYNKAFLPVWPDEFTADVAHDTLPSVSWVVPSLVESEHPSAAPLNGEVMISGILQALTANPKVWAKTVLIVSYDENGGFFDHVSPPVAPPGTPGEFVTPRAPTAQSGGILGPIGLGFRVPMLMVSPFSRGGYVNSDTFDHTSQIRLLEERFGIHCPNISNWRRKAVGDLTSMLNLKNSDTSVPAMPAATEDGPVVRAECPDNQSPFSLTAAAPGLTIPAEPTMPTQEPGTARRRLG